MLWLFQIVPNTNHLTGVVQDAGDGHGGAGGVGAPGDGLLPRGAAAQHDGGLAGRPRLLCSHPPPPTRPHQLRRPQTRTDSEVSSHSNLHFWAAQFDAALARICQIKICVCQSINQFHVGKNFNCRIFWDHLVFNIYWNWLLSGIETFLRPIRFTRS